MTVAPTKVQSVATHNIEITNLQLVRNNVGLQCPLTRPLVNALGAWAYASQRGRVVIAYLIVRPGDSQLGIALLRNLARLDRLSSLCNVSHPGPSCRPYQSKRRRQALNVYSLPPDFQQHRLDGFGFYLAV